MGSKEKVLLPSFGTPLPGDRPRGTATTEHGTQCATHPDSSTMALRGVSARSFSCSSANMWHFVAHATSTSALLWQISSALRSISSGTRIDIVSSVERHLAKNIFWRCSEHAPNGYARVLALDGTTTTPLQRVGDGQMGECGT